MKLFSIIGRKFRRKRQPPQPLTPTAEGETFDYGTLMTTLPELSDAQAAADVANRDPMQPEVNRHQHTD